ncbi:glycosyl hydrolase family 61-domain-containing protein [Cadophora sp. MPI-SDFR-AT-0126]|nr:glycosyl hydrolase family 61-domain-containing protein [Leotiomycetes sp. MPI-SDFR-AT-0126]
MRSFTSLLVIFCVLLHHASAHYIFWQLKYGGTKYPTYTYVRKNTNMNSPVTDLASNDLRCNAGGESGAATDTLEVKAGGEFTWTLDTAVYHNGATAMYMAKAPTTAKEYDGSGQRWFKIVEIGPTFSGGNPTWPLWQTYTYRIPPATPNGEYLLRIEQLALHNPGGTPQFYISCAQVSVSGGGSGTPGPLVSIPGYVKGTEAGYTVNIYNNFKSYTLVGPSVWAGQNDTSPPVVVPSTTSKVTTPTPTITSVIVPPTSTPTSVIVPSIPSTTSIPSTSINIATPPTQAQVTLISTVYATKWNTSFIFFTATSTTTVISPSILTTTLTSSCASVETVTQDLGGATITASGSALPAATVTLISTSISTAPPVTTTTTLALPAPTAPSDPKTITVTSISLSLFTITTHEISTITEFSTITISSGSGTNTEAGGGSGGGGGGGGGGGEGGTIALWSQCGGKDWNGSGSCVVGAVCRVSNEFYSQCVAG